MTSHESRVGDVPTPAEIITFDDAPPPDGASACVEGAHPATDIALADADPGWSDVFVSIAATIKNALGERAIMIEHVGSTAVPGLAAKPVIDVGLTVADSADEAAYLPDLLRLGFEHIVREPWWYEHRCLRLAEPRCNLHVFSPGCPEPVRHRIFRDWLTANAADRRLYEQSKRDAAEAARTSGEDVTGYNARKQAVIRAIYGRAFAAAGLVGDPGPEALQFGEQEG